MTRLKRRKNTGYQSLNTEISITKFARPFYSVCSVSAFCTDASVYTLAEAGN